MVLAAVGSELDHPAFRGLPPLVYAATQRRRVAAGWRSLAGNHVLIESCGPIGHRSVVIALCHLQRNSVRVSVGHEVRRGDVIARCGNSGNSTEPHVHIQASDSSEFGNAGAVPITFGGALPGDGHIVDVERA